MRFQTQIPLIRQDCNLINYNSKLFLLGSCFSESIGKKLDYYKFQNFQNPFGILFHPLAIETLIRNVINEKEYTEDDIFFNNEQWHCFDAHSKLSNSSKEVLLENLNKQISLTTKQLYNSSHVIITLGTAWKYRFIERDKIVANCHKVPQKKFLKELLSVDEISESLQAIIALIRSVNKNASIIFTVSPVRHLKDGFIENTQSKAHLIAAIHKILNQQSFYFPSYEIMMDELRDYRFYKEDMIHPNQTAVNYIWEAFQNVWISSESSKIMDEIATIQRGLEHKPFNPNSEAHLQFIQHLQSKQAEIQSKIPHISF